MAANKQSKSLSTKKTVTKGIGELAKEAIMEGYTFESTLKFIKKAHPDTKFSKRCYYWYRSHLHTDEGKEVPKATK